MPRGRLYLRRLLPTSRSRSPYIDPSWQRQEEPTLLHICGLQVFDERVCAEGPLSETHSQTARGCPKLIFLLLFVCLLACFWGPSRRCCVWCSCYLSSVVFLRVKQNYKARYDNNENTTYDLEHMRLLVQISRVLVTLSLQKQELWVH